MAEDSWSDLGDELESFKTALRRSTAVNVNTQALRDSAKQIVQRYFRAVRSGLVKVGFSDEELEAFDSEMQALLVLSQGRNAKSSYLRAIDRIRKMRVAIDAQREVRLGEHRGKDAVQPDSTERRIIDTLRGLVPTAADSYEQALHDLGASRLSYRGTAVELRETLREVLDHLAPDGDVMKSDGFSLEKGRDRPTHKQKVRYILRSRDVPRTARAAPEGNVDLIEELTGSLTRATYNRGSLDTHIAPTEGEARQLKMYVDTVLAELLEIHANQ